MGIEFLYNFKYLSKIFIRDEGMVGTVSLSVKSKQVDSALKGTMRENMSLQLIGVFWMIRFCQLFYVLEQDMDWRWIV